MSFGKLKHPIPTQAEIQQVERVRSKIPTEKRVYPHKALLIPVCAVTEERRAAEAKRMNESPKRRLMMGFQGKKKKSQQQDAVPASSIEADLEDQTLADRLRRSVPTEGTSSRAAGKRPFTVDLDAEPVPKRGRQTELPWAVFVVDNDDELADPVTLACPSKTVQFAHHMILGSQMELSEIEDLPKKLLREEAGRAFCLQASASMDMWLCVKQAINAAEKAKKAYEDSRARVVEAGKAIQDHANLAKDFPGVGAAIGKEGSGGEGGFGGVGAGQGFGDRGCCLGGYSKVP
ncbi:unnamed protein product [Prunus armeniaca]